MKLTAKNITTFQDKYLPKGTELIGLSALVQALGVEAPVRHPCCVLNRRTKESVKETAEWLQFDNKYTTEKTVQAQLTFAMRHEHIDLLVLKCIFLALPEKIIADYISSAPTGQIARRVWFLYEFLTEKRLLIADCGKVTVVDLLDRKRYFTCEGTVSLRHKVRNNLLGSENFCPIIRRTEKLERFISKDLSNKAKVLVSKVSAQLIARAASFLLLADTRASFAIEGERLPRNKAERWLKAIQQVGKHKLTIDEIQRLHEILIEDRRFVASGFRKEGVFLGSHKVDGEPLPEFIGAKPEDLKDLVNGLLNAHSIMLESELDAVIHAAVIAFGFVYIHPYEDGNGRIHRCLIHHVLAEKKFSPTGMVFPVSSAMLNMIDDYQQTLQNHTGPLMSYVRWTPTDKGNVQVINDTADLYKYFDCTEASEFLYRCVEETINHDVPNELEYLKRRDEVMQKIMNIVEMPDQMADKFIMFMRQNDWKLPKKRRQDEFAKLTDQEADELELIVRKGFIAE